MTTIQELSGLLAGALEVDPMLEYTLTMPFLELTLVKFRFGR